ncbi:MAG: type II toxin-antitoxin system PemK/MazF family toxin [Chloroflexi bacterium]|nr:type II toxin-antitoxin system PemK/MazF family toxin [Chloroflexota bacterium]
MVRFGPVTGAEIGKTRPALIVSNDLNNERAATVTVLPITSAPAKRRYLDEVAVPRGTAGLKLDSRIKANMIRTVDKVRLTTLVGPIPESLYEQVNRALRLHLNVPG